MSRHLATNMAALGRRFCKLRPRSAPLWALGLALSLLGCASRAPSAPSEIPSGARLDRYDFEAGRLFDQIIDPKALGLLASSSSLSRTESLLLRERARRAHVVTRVRVQTVTLDSARGIAGYQLVLAAVDEPLGRAELPRGRVEIEIGPQTPAFGVAKSFDTRLVGRHFLGFFRWFLEGDEPRLHWHLTADDPESLAVAREAALDGPSVEADAQGPLD